MPRTTWIILAAVASAFLLGAQSPREDSTAEDAKFDAVAQKYRQAVRNRPYRGPTFDSWYRHYLDAGRLDRLEAEVESAARMAPNDMASQIILGLVRERKGRDDDAARAYADAGKLAGDRYEPPALLGVLCARLSRFEEAARALTEAVGRHPPRADLLDLLKRLGQCYQRQGKTAEAVATWSGIADRFPNDRRVLAELAALLGNEGQIDEAIRRWEQVASLAGQDLHQQLAAQLEIADLLIRKEKPPEALERLKRVLDRVEPDGWRAKDVHHRIGNLFLARNDQAGRVAFYAERCRLRPDDLTSALQLTDALMRSGGVAEAIARQRSTIASAPNRRDLREALIGGLERAGRIDEALAECRALDAKVPNDSDILKRLGMLTLKSAAKDRREDAERQAVEIWSRLAAARPDDPSAALQAAELCRREASTSETPGAAHKDADTPLLKAAESLYREAVRRSKGTATAWEVLGEFLHARGRPREAVAAWSEIVKPPTDNPASWHRLAEVLDHFGYPEDARAACDQALAGEPDNFDYHQQRFRLAFKAEEYPQAMGAVESLERLADRPRRVETALRAHVDVAEAAGWLDREIGRLRDARAKAAISARDVWLLGLLLARDGQFAAAAAVLEGASDGAAEDLLVMKAAADAHEEAGNRLGALKVYRRLAEREPGQAIAHLGKIASLELEVGGVDAAKAAAETLVRRHPGDLNGYRLRSDIAFRLGNPRDGLDWLRRAMRAGARDLPIRLDLAAALAKHGAADEAEEHYWRGFELAEQLDDKRSIVAALAELARSSRTEDRFLDRLRRLRNSHEDSKSLTLCLVEALRALGDPTGARLELEKLAASGPDDLETLKMLADLAAAQNDLAAAVGYQERVVALAPEADQIEALAEFHRARGDIAAADETVLRLIETEDREALAVAVARMIDQMRIPDAKRLATLGLRRRPDDWRLLFLAGLAQLATKETEGAVASFEAVLASPEDMTPLTPASPASTAGGLSSASAKRPPAPSTPFPAGSPTRKSTFNPMVQGDPRLGNPLADVPPGKLGDLDEVRDALSHWQSLEILLMAAQQPQPPARVQSRVPSRAVGGNFQTTQANFQLAQVVNSRMLQLQAALQQAQQAQQVQQMSMLLNELNRLQAQLMQLQQNPRPGSSSGPRQGLALASGLRKDQRSVRLQSIMGLAAAARQSGREEELIRGLRKSAQSDARRGRAPVLAALALNRPELAREAIEDLIRLRPEDPFPHIVRLFLRGRPAPGVPSPVSGISTGASDGPETAEILASFRWLIARRPEIRDDLTFGMVNILIYGMGDVDEAAKVLSATVAAADLETLVRLAGLTSRIGDIPLQGAILDRAIGLAGGQAGSPTIAQSLQAILKANLLYSDDDAYLRRVLGLLDGCLAQGDNGDSMASAPPPPAPVTPMMNASPKWLALQEFPPATPCLDAARLEALRLVYMQFEAADRIPAMVEHLAGKAGEMSGRTRRAYGLACGLVPWWRGDRGSAMATLERLAAEAPYDEGLALVRVHGHLLGGDLVQALAALGRVNAETSPLAAEFDQVRAAVADRLRHGTRDQYLDALLLVLGGRSREPDLGFLFGGPDRPGHPVARSSASIRMAAANPQPTSVPPRSRAMISGASAGGGNPMPIASAATPAGATSVRNLDDLLSHAKSRGQLDAIEQAANAQWDRHRGSSRLGALVILARFAQGNIPSAAEAADRWGALLAGRPELGGEVEAVWIAGQCLDHAPTEALGRKFARVVIPATRARNLHQESLDLALRSIRSAVGTDQKDEALAEIQQLMGTLKAGQVPPRVAR